MINGEPTESRLASGAKGSLRVIVRTQGREAHSAYPELGRSAIEPLLTLLSALRTLPLPTDPVLGATTVNIGVLRGGTEANIIPGHAEAELMVRIVGDLSGVKATLEAWARGVADLEYGSYIPPQYFHTVSGFPAAPVAYTSDIPLLDRWGTPLLFGPGSIRVAHTPDERASSSARAPRECQCLRASGSHTARRMTSRAAPASRGRPGPDVHANPHPHPHPGGQRWPVAVLGATGTVGQSFVRLLADHPWFELAVVAASERSVGRLYRDAAQWLEGGMPNRVATLRLVPCVPEAVDAPIIFSALDSAAAGEIEPAFARAGRLVLSNAKNFRMEPMSRWSYPR